MAGIERKLGADRCRVEGGGGRDSLPPHEPGHERETPLATHEQDPNEPEAGPSFDDPKDPRW